MTGRRNFLKILGGGVILGAGGGAAWALTRDPAAARAAWSATGEPVSDPRIRWLSHAILAPNPHNRQPWVADLHTPGEITLMVDLDRRLPDTDPFDRQITIGLGAFLELARMAAAEEGVGLQIEGFPEGASPQTLDHRRIARIRVAGTADPDPLFAEILNRRTNRLPFDTARPVPADVLSRLAEAAGPLSAYHASDVEQVAVLRDIAWRAMETEMQTPATVLESVNLTRIGRAEIEANPDGISLAGPMIEGLALAGLVSREAMLDPASQGFKQMMAAMRPGFDTAMAFFWIATEGNDRMGQLAAGRAYVRANLAATAEGVAMQPLSQALQEFPEMADSYAELAAALSPAPGHRVQMFARLGYAPAVPGSPRWPLDTRIRTA
jgi:hypothetical protein